MSHLIADPASPRHEGKDTRHIGFSADCLPELRHLLLSRAANVRPVHNGYDFTFAGSDVNADALLDFIRFEWQCRPLLTFSRAVPPAPESLILSLTGGASVTAFIRDTFVALTPTRLTQPTGSFSS